MKLMIKYFVGIHYDNFAYVLVLIIIFVLKIMNKWINKN